MSHYASLVVAEKPLEAHQSYRRRRSSVVSGQLPPDLEMGGQVCSQHAKGRAQDHAHQHVHDTVIGKFACSRMCSL